MMTSRSELAEAIRFAGSRAAAATAYVDDWDYATESGWTTREHFAHVASWAGHLPRIHTWLTESGWLTREHSAPAALERLAPFFDRTPHELAEVIQEGYEADAAFAESLDEAALARPLRVGPYEMPLAELLAFESANHAIHHVTEATLRAPLA